MIPITEHEAKLKEVRAFMSEHICLKYDRKIKALRELLSEAYAELDKNEDYPDICRLGLLLKIKAELRNDK